MTSRLTKVTGCLRSRMRIPDRASDAETALLRYLVYGVLPVWSIPGLLDWNQHRGSRIERNAGCLLYTSPSPRDMRRSRMPSSA